MTVPGKGGRPRKWRSDADRQRAWRNRTNGAPEPPTLAQALDDDSDELARTWQTIRDLGTQLDTANAQAKALQVELNRTRRNHATDNHRWDRLTTDNQHLRADNQRLRSERDQALAHVRDLETRLRQPAPTPPPAPQTPALTRAERRRLDRQQHRR